MGRKILWLVVSGLMALSLVIAACGPAATPTTPTAPVTPALPATPTTPTTPVTEKPQKEVVAPAPEAPKYGGALTYSQIMDTIYFDEGVNRTMSASGLTHEELMQWDWSRGPEGTGELCLTYSGFHRQNFYVGSMAESWEYKPPDTMILHIRHGVHFGLNPAFEASKLVNGREMTADDIVFSLKRLNTEPGAYIYNSYTPLAKVVQITAPDKNTVIIKCTPDTFMDLYHTFSSFYHIIAPELVQKYGNVDGWRNQVGTGPFMISDYVPGSLIAYIRNPNYWMKDPVGPGKGNQLPYLDGVRLLTIPDTSTRQAALRTGKIDQNTAYTIDDRNAELKRTPQLRDTVYWGHGGVTLDMHIYDPALPFKDVRVRRAMVMALDYKTIVNQLYGGSAEYFDFPFANLKDYSNIWIPLEQMPASVQEMYTYNPDKARQLLKEAGYPTGFKTIIAVLNTQQNVDYLSVVKDMWAKVGIELTIDPREQAVYNVLWRNFTYKEMVMAGGGGIGAYYRLICFSGTDYWNPSQINEPYIEDVRAKIAAIFNSTMDWNEIDRLYRELKPKVIDQAYVIPTPIVHYYTLWWPWIKNYSGETDMSFGGGGSWQKFVWLDQDLKKAMGH